MSENTESGQKDGALAGQDKTADTQSGVQAGPRAGGPGLTAVLALLLAFAAAGFSGWQMYETRRVNAEMELDLARKLSEIQTIGEDSRRMSSGARDIARESEARLGQLEASIVGVQNQRMALESLYQELSRSRDEWTLAEVEQALLIASQQLQLASNVKAALIALEAADARLARSDRPQLTQIRRAIANDIERLSASPFVDVTGIGLKLERMMTLIDGMPLATDTRPRAEASQAVHDAGSGWRQAMSEVWQDVMSLVRVQRVNVPEAPLLAPDQAFFLRENLRLRLLSARLALVSRDQDSYKTDLDAAADWMKRYYDADAQQVSKSIETLQQLASANIDIKLPDVSASLDALRGYRLMSERSVR